MRDLELYKPPLRGEIGGDDQEYEGRPPTREELAELDLALVGYCREVAWWRYVRDALVAYCDEANMSDRVESDVAGSHVKLPTADIGYGDMIVGDGEWERFVCVLEVLITDVPAEGSPQSQSSADGYGPAHPGVAQDNSEFSVETRATGQDHSVTIGSGGFASRQIFAATVFDHPNLEEARVIIEGFKDSDAAELWDAAECAVLRLALQDQTEKARAVRKQYVAALLYPGLNPKFSGSDIFDDASMDELGLPLQGRSTD
ncbi:MAG TPA: hypothetical protein VNX65_05365 [Patescibacteria group bacterium]|jgi:hypothetical protein|nr:hypothetical protein [Patescibacteria group bacterium]